MKGLVGSSEGRGLFVEERILAIAASHSVESETVLAARINHQLKTSMIVIPYYLLGNNES